MEDKNLSPPVLYRIYGQLRNLLDPEATAEHQHEHGPVSEIRDDTQEPPDLLILQVPGQRLGQTQRDPGDGISHWYPLLLNEIVEQETDRLQVAQDRLRPSSLPQQVIYVEPDLLAGHLRKGDGQPSHELIEDIHIALHRVGRVVFSLQGSPVA